MELRKRLDGLQTKVVEAVGVASQSQVKEINRELSRLSKKLDRSALREEAHPAPRPAASALA